MGRTACIDLPAFPLQLLAERHPDWRTHPAAVVDADRPQGLVRWVNERARAFRILPGMRYATALSLARDLRAGVVDENDLEDATRRLTETFQRFTPGVEPAGAEPGVFWLDASGLDRLHPSLERWGVEIHDALGRAGFAGRVAVGFTRYGSYAAVKGARFGVLLLESPERERALAARVRIDRLGFDPRVRDTLARLGITTLGGFLRLPEEGLRRRFGSELARLHRLARGELHVPITPAELPEPIVRTHLFDHSETHLDRLTAAVSVLLGSGLEALAARGQVLTALGLRVGLDLGGEIRERLRPASPTRDHRQLLGLVRLRLEHGLRELRGGAIELELRVEGARERTGQLALFVEKPLRDLRAANRALARLRALLGEEAVRRAVLREGHLPEARFGWAPIPVMRAPEIHGGVTPPSPRPLVRRILARPVRLAAGLWDGPVHEVSGAHLVAGGWWVREVARAYHYLRTEPGGWLWAYEDQRRRQWFRQGAIG